MKDAGLDPALAVAVVPNAATAHLAVTQTARMRDGERVLVHGALGGLAVGFPGIARQLGASRVVGTVRASDLGAEGKQNSRTTRSSIPLSCPHAWRASASISSSTPLAVPSAPPASGSSRRWDACSRSATPAETGTRSTATGSGSGTWPFTAFRWGFSSRATRTSRDPRYSCDPCRGRRPRPGQRRAASPLQRGSGACTAGEPLGEWPSRSPP
jgi:hypothetical protein